MPYDTLLWVDDAAGTMTLEGRAVLFEPFCHAGFMKVAKLLGPFEFWPSGKCLFEWFPCFSSSSSSSGACFMTDDGIIDILGLLRRAVSDLRVLKSKSLALASVSISLVLPLFWACIGSGSIKCCDGAFVDGRAVGGGSLDGAYFWSGRLDSR
jgi:hypothetical protein